MRPRRPQRGFTLFELIVVIIIFAALATVLLARLAYYQETVERVAMETTVRLVKTGLQIRLAELIIGNRQGEAGMLEETDPMSWLERKPANYGGAWRDGAEPGNWYFDKAGRQLMYVVNTGNRLDIDTETGRKVLHFRVRLLKSLVNVPGGAVESVSGVSFSAVEPYRWP
jgi:prepilin-type N-terminal cleavage/methylation domain-containing protein